LVHFNDVHVYYGPVVLDSSHELHMSQKDENTDFVVLCQY